MSSEFDPFDLQKVLDVLRDAGFSSASWRPLGRRLKPGLDLDAIEKNYDKVERCLEEVISSWQRDGDTSWEKLAEAVAQCKDEGGGGKNVAQKIRERVGLEPPKQVVEQDSSNVPSSRPTGPDGHDLPRQTSDDSAIGSEGRQSLPTSPVSPQLPFCSFSDKTDMLSEEEVKEGVDNFNSHFNDMVTDTQNALDKSRADPRKVVNILRLPNAEFQSRYEGKEFFDSLKAAADVIDLFGELNDHWDHFNYYLLEQLIGKRAIEKIVAICFKELCTDLQNRMKRYTVEMQAFRRRTSVEIYYKVIPQPRREVPNNFVEVVKECKSSDMKTLHDVEKFRREFAHKCKLYEWLVFLKYIGMGSVLITLWIPKSVSLPPELEMFIGEDDNEGSSVDPTPFNGDSQTQLRPPEVEELPPDSELPVQGEPPEDGGQTKAIAKKESLAFSVLTTVSKLVVPKNVVDPFKLMGAVTNGDKSEVEKLISQGADPNAHPMMIQFTPLMEASRIGNTEIAQLLIDKGADPNLTNIEGWTALMAAANNGRGGTVDVLLRNGANPDMQDQSGWSALMAAVYKHHDDIALRLCEAEATPHLQDKNHTNALLLAIAKEGRDRVVDALLDLAPDLNLQDSYGETALIFACKIRNLRFVKRLLSMDADPNIANNYKETPVLIATGLGEKEILEELLKKGADPNIGAEPPILVASDLGFEDIADLLVIHGADLNKHDERGVMAFEVAEQRNFSDLAQKLNPQQFSSRTPRDVFKLTKKSLDSLQSHLNRGPLFLNPEAKPGVISSALRGLLQTLNVH